VENGLEFEPWLDDLVTSSGSNAARVVASDGVDRLPAAELEESGDEEGELNEAGEDEQGESDPHIWHDPQNAQTMVENIRAALVEADPANAASYNANAEAYTAEIETLDAYIQDQVATLPEARRKLVTSHDTFGYFARRYGFEVIGTVIPSVSTEVADPAAGELAALIDEIEAAGAPAIFDENVTNPDLLEQVAASAGVTVAPPLYTDALGTPDSSGGTYLEMARYNVDTIVQALGE
jgi:ABC-type Zn uptake system ZnuABC Zn-binding protein ZnuA